MWYGAYTTPHLYIHQTDTLMPPLLHLWREPHTHTMHNVQHVRAPGYTYTLSLSYRQCSI